VSTWTKSTARMPRAWAARNCFHVGPGRRGAGQSQHHAGSATPWRSDPVAELDELALHSPVPPRRVICCHADHEHADHGCRGRPPGTPSARVIPLACDQPPVPGQQCRRGHRERLAPSPPGDQPGQCREPQPVGWLVADPADLAAKHRVLMPEHQELGVLGHLMPGHHHEAAKQTTNEQVDDRNDHSAMIPAGKSVRAKIQ
jgi:hypothetical protein